MGCWQSRRHGGLPASHAGEGNATVEVATGNRSGSPSAAAIAAAMCISGHRRNDESSMEEIRRSYLQGRLKVEDGCPLTDRQLYGLIKSWKAINRNMSVTAINMFVR